MEIRLKTVIKIVLTNIAILGLITFGVDQFEQAEEKKNCLKNRHVPYGWYEKYVKRPVDAILATGALIILSPIIVIIALLVRMKLGSPVIFTQKRPGKNEHIFKLYKFRTMTNEKNENGELLPDSMRLTNFGRKLRSTSLDELPELLNIIRGDMAIIGPRPQLVRDMVFMTSRQRQRHVVRPGLSGLAQVHGRNSISWEEKLEMDLVYIKKITFLQDLRIILETVVKVFRGEGVVEDGEATTLDLGDHLLKTGKVSKLQYDNLQSYANSILKRN
jgi:undecaprenyl phosphate N,N'-diacetylbacillosamine 1-phosphate transferase